MHPKLIGIIFHEPGTWGHDWCLWSAEDQITDSFHTFQAAYWHLAALHSVEPNSKRLIKHVRNNVHVVLLKMEVAS